MSLSLLVMSPHHFDQMSQRSQVSRIGLWRCSLNVYCIFCQIMSWFKIANLVPFKKVFIWQYCCSCYWCSPPSVPFLMQWSIYTGLFAFLLNWLICIPVELNSVAIRLASFKRREDQRGSHGIIWLTLARRYLHTPGSHQASEKDKGRSD